ncbi:hypothetical protein [Spirosoma pomorum]
MTQQLKWIVLLVSLELISMLADYFIKKASLLAGLTGWGWLVTGGMLYGATALGWFFMMRSFNLVTIGLLHSFGAIALSLLLGLVVFHETISLREVAGITLGCVSIGLLVHFD